VLAGLGGMAFRGVCQVPPQGGGVRVGEGGSGRTLCGYRPSGLGGRVGPLDVRQADVAGGPGRATGKHMAGAEAGGDCKRGDGSPGGIGNLTPFSRKRLHAERRMGAVGADGVRGAGEWNDVVGGGGRQNGGRGIFGEFGSWGQHQRSNGGHLVLRDTTGTTHWMRARGSKKTVV
jgi:hypothetical protein